MCSLPIFLHTRALSSLRNDLPTLDEKVRRFEEWLFLNAASVLLSEKAGELLTLDLGEFAMDEAAAHDALERVAAQWDFHFSVLCASNGLMKFILYDIQRLAAVLDAVPACVMVGQLGYTFPLQPESFLAEIQRRWKRSSAIPHEIGIALGYPLDDVFGFMGLLPLPCKGVCGWRVYGCFQESKRLSCAFNRARCRALTFLAQTSPRRITA